MPATLILRQRGSGLPHHRHCFTEGYDWEFELDRIQRRMDGLELAGPESRSKLRFTSRDILVGKKVFEIPVPVKWSVLDLQVEHVRLEGTATFRCRNTFSGLQVVKRSVSVARPVRVMYPGGEIQ